MGIFKNILFLEDYPINVRTTDEAARSYATGYGNHIASARAFAPLGHAHAHAHAITPTSVAARDTPRAEATRALATCT